MIIYYQSRIKFPKLMKPIICILLFCVIGTYTLEKFQYESFYDTNNKIKYTRYYIITSTNKTTKNKLGFKQKQLYYYTSI